MDREEHKEVAYSVGSDFIRLKSVRPKTQVWEDDICLGFPEYHSYSSSVMIQVIRCRDRYKYCLSLFHFFLFLLCGWFSHRTMIVYRQAPILSIQTKSSLVLLNSPPPSSVPTSSFPTLHQVFHFVPWHLRLKSLSSLSHLSPSNNNT
jgi:hypothetical protein